MQNKTPVKLLSIVSTILYNYHVTLIGPLQLHGRHYRESYTHSTNQIANYWNTYGEQEVKENESSLLVCTFHSATQVFT